MVKQKSRIGGDTLGLVDRLVGTDKNHATSPNNHATSPEITQPLQKKKWPKNA
jgi:hypothetical protein